MGETRHMKSIPLPLRLAAGLAVSAAERARDLPRQITGLPVTVASQLLQFSMRVQQQVTELAIKGDEALSGLYPVEETPSWATFDEELAYEEETFGARGRYGSPFDRADDELDDPADSDELDAADLALPEPRYSSNGHGGPAHALPDHDAPSDPWEAEQEAIAEEIPAVAEAEAAEARGDAAGAPAAGPHWLPNYAELSLPQLRARLRTFSPDQLAELLDHERAHADRDEFTGMLTRRIETVRKQEAERSEPDQTS